MQLHVRTGLWRCVLTAGVVFFGASIQLSAQDDDYGLSNLAWRTIGPNYTGGRIVDVDVDPTNKDILYAASGSGGLFRSDNRGTTWKCIFENEGTISIGDMAVDPNNGDVIWVGTGESNNQRSSYWGDGIYKSVDGGKTWKNTGLGDSHHIGRIIVDPENSDVVYVAALGHLYSHNEERGLFKTTDGGETWEKVLYVNDAVGAVDVVLDPSDSNTIYAATYERLRRAWHFDGAGPGSAIYKSSDAGASWTRLSGGLPDGDLGRIGIDISRQNPKTVYATVSNQNPQATQAAAVEVGSENDDGEIETGLGLKIKYEDDQCKVASTSQRGGAGRDGLRAGDVIIEIGGKSASDKDATIEYLKSIKPGDRVSVVFERDSARRAASVAAVRPTPRQIGGEVYKTEDGGETWTKVNERPVGGTPAYYYGQIRVDPQDDKRLYILSVPLYTSEDGGKTWNTIARSVHVDHHALWIDPDAPNRLILGNDGGFHLSYDYGVTWDWVYNLPLCQFYAIGVDHQQPYHVYGGLQDNGSIGGPSSSRSRSVNRLQWYRVGGGDGFYVQVDPEDHNILFSESQFGAINRLNRSTGQFTSIRPPNQPGESPNRYNWNSPILMSVHDSRQIYFGSNRLFRSRNRGDDWEAISPDLTTNNRERIAGNVPHCTITTIDQSVFDENWLLVGTDDGKVHLTTDGGETWQDLSNRFPLRPAEWWCSRVAFSPHARNTILVSFTGYREDDFRPFVFRSADLGETFTSIASNLEQAPINVIKPDPKSNNVYYVGTEFGVWVTLDQGENWHPLSNGLPRVAVHDLLVHPRDNDLVIGTHGRGIYIMDNVSPIQAMSQMKDEQDVVLFQPQGGTFWRSERGQGISGDRAVDFPNPSRDIAIYYYVNSQSEGLEFSLAIENEDGDLVAELDESTDFGLHRSSWNYSRRSGQRGRGNRGGGGGQRPGVFGVGSQNQIGPGTYWAVLKSGDEVQRKKFVLSADERN